MYVSSGYQKYDPNPFPHKVPESSEISLGLYVGDPREGKERPLTETFIIPWTDDGYSHQPELLQKLKCLFTVSREGEK